MEGNMNHYQNPYVLEHSTTQNWYDNVPMATTDYSKYKTDKIEEYQYYLNNPNNNHHYHHNQAEIYNGGITTEKLKQNYFLQQQNFDYEKKIQKEKFMYEGGFFFHHHPNDNKQNFIQSSKNVYHHDYYHKFRNKLDNDSDAIIKFNDSNDNNKDFENFFPIQENDKNNFVDNNAQKIHNICDNNYGESNFLVGNDEVKRVRMKLEGKELDNRIPDDRRWNWNRNFIRIDI
ncbi:conserved hypothetical protein [Pediculus humanus corporis]|uniref:Uncharacterized protein n=1 Tax=Pediculus humanus subsp. corporis TaxID=121224 RepID=E0VKK4_PEDHC|nr:uncharacterized protein Phum_PHUM266320 [Pediculus humanus corporis]EEB13910.1 conserved hypothetical protein [Pediculus humanus corporis]